MRHRLLLVDDECWLMESMIAHLRDEGYEVETAETVRAAMDVLQRERFDAVILDCLMPTGDESLDPRSAGVELVNRIRIADPEVGDRNQDVPIVVLTAICNPDSLERLGNGHVQGILRKPVSTFVLLDEIKRLLTDR